MTQTYRTNDPARWGTGQGFNLSPAQVDVNFWDLIQRMIAQESRPDPAAGIAYFSISGTMMYVHMTDGTVLGPYELPVATFYDRGVWAPSVIYTKMDTFTINGGLYVVVFNHTSNATFDAGANDGAGHDYYKLMIQTPGSTLPSGGVSGTVLIKAGTVDFACAWGHPNAEVVYFIPATGSVLTASNVADALEEAAMSGGDAANIPYTPSTGSGLVSDNVQEALDELGTIISSIEPDTIGVGKQTIWVPASAMVPRLTNGPSEGIVETPTNKNMVRTLDFDPSVNEYAQFDITMPKSWDKGPITFDMYYSRGTGSTSTQVVWGIRAIALVPSGMTLDIPFGSPQIIFTAIAGADLLYHWGEWDPLTILDGNGNPPVDGDLIMFQVYRDAVNGSDVVSTDVRLHGINIFYVTNALTDD